MYLPCIVLGIFITSFHTSLLIMKLTGYFPDNSGSLLVLRKAIQALPYNAIFA